MQKIKQAIMELANSNKDVRQEAMKIVVLGGENSVEPLIEALEINDPVLRRTALQALVYLKSPRAKEYLGRFVLEADSSDPLKALALRGLVDALVPDDAERVLLPLARMTRDEDLFIRAIAVEGLGKLADERGFPFIKAARKDSESWVREAADNAMLRMKTVGIRTVRKKPTPSANSGGDFADEQLVILLSSRKEPERTMAISEILKKGSRAFELFMNAFNGGHELGRRSAIIGFGELKSKQSYEPLIDVLESPVDSAELKAYALRALALLHLPGTLDPVYFYRLLERMSRHQDPFVGAAALTAAASVDDPDFVRLVASGLKNRDQWVRDSAADGLRKMANSPNKDVQTKAKMILWDR